MKHLFTLLLILTLVCCTKKGLLPEEVAKNNIEEYLMQSLNDPESYEFVKISKLDTVYKKDHYQKMVNQYRDLFESVSDYPETIKESNNFADEFEKYGKHYDAERARKDAKELQDIYDKAKNNLENFTNKLNNSKEDEILDITTLFTCRATNKMGGKVLANYNVVLTDSLTVKEMEQQR